MIHTFFDAHVSIFRAEHVPPRDVNARMDIKRPDDELQSVTLGLAERSIHQRAKRSLVQFNRDFFSIGWVFVVIDKLFTSSVP